MVGLGTKCVRIENVPQEIHRGTLRARLTPYGEIRSVQEEKWLNVHRYAV
jgi:hypothetical protein